MGISHRFCLEQTRFHTLHHMGNTLCCCCKCQVQAQRACKGFAKIPVLAQLSPWGICTLCVWGERSCLALFWECLATSCCLEATFMPSALTKNCLRHMRRTCTGEGGHVEACVVGMQVETQGRTLSEVLLLLAHVITSLWTTYLPNHCGRERCRLVILILCLR